MAKTEPTKTPDAPAAIAAPTTATEALPLPALGAVCTVRVAKGIDLMNNETGVHFVPEQDTPVTCTVTLLRRLQDGDLTLVA